MEYPSHQSVTKPVRWYQSLRFRIIRFLLILVLLMSLAIDLVIETFGHDKAYKQQIELVGLRNSMVVNKLSSQFIAIEATATSLAQIFSMYSDKQQILDAFSSGVSHSQLFSSNSITGVGIWPAQDDMNSGSAGSGSTGSGSAGNGLVGFGWRFDAQGEPKWLSDDEQKLIRGRLSGQYAKISSEQGWSCWNSQAGQPVERSADASLICFHPYQWETMQGVITIELDQHWLRTMVNLLSEELGGKILLFSHADQLLSSASSSPDVTQELVSILGPMLSQMQRRSTSPLPATDAREIAATAFPEKIALSGSDVKSNMLVYAYDLPRFEGSVITLIPEAPLLETVDNDSRTTLLLLLSAMLVSLAIGYILLDHNILAPLTRLRRQLYKLEGNEPLNESISMERNDEVGRLIKAFNQRSSKLIEARRSAESAAIARQNFLANMSHELRTPMNGILGASELLADQSLSKDSSEYVSMIRGSAQSMLVVLNDILDLSKIEAGQMKLESIRFNLYELLEQLCNMVRPSLHKELRVQLKLNCQELLHHEYYGDPIRLQQILLNLLNNAVKFTDQGSIEVRARTVKVGDGYEQLLIEVEDSGIGIPVHRLNDIFERFTQAEYSTSRRFGGTGLGLAISKRLADLMSAELTVDSEVDRGTCFSLSIPLVTASLNDSHPGFVASEHMLSKLKGKKLLLVEDNKVNQVIARRMLEQLGLIIIQVDNGAQALEQAETQVFDLILMDVLMPIMNGLETTRILRQGLSPNQQTPVIAMTANVLEKDIRDCHEAGMQGYVSKPVSRRTLEEEIAWVLGLVQRQQEQTNITPIRPGGSINGH